MDIHKPKPVHGWREFLSEIGVIVVGVAIALTGEQAVEALHWRHQVESAHEALASDFESLTAEAAEREVMSGCVGQRLDGLAATLDEAGRTGRLPPIGVLGNPTDRTWRLASWDGLVAAQVATHLPRTELLAISGLSNALNGTNERNDDELAQWSVLYTMVGPGRALGPGEQESLRRALVQARLDAKYLRLGAYQIDQEVIRTGFLSPERHAQVSRDATAAAQAQDSLCKPIGAVPKLYAVATPSRVELTGPIRQFRLRTMKEGAGP